MGCFDNICVAHTERRTMATRQLADKGATVKTIMIIPAKGFSRRIPRKNLKPFCGIPLVSLAALQGQCSRLVDEVWVSTDSDEIAAAVEPYGAHVMFRNYEDTEETPGTIPVLETITRLGDRIGDDDIILIHLCTSPVLKPDDFDRLAMALRSMQYFSKGNIASITFRVEHRTIIASHKAAQGRGVAPTLFSDNDYDIITTKACTSANMGLYMKRQAAVDQAYRDMWKQDVDGMYIPLEEWQEHDVDTLEEWEYAELAMEHYILKGRGVQAYREYAK